MSALPFLIGDRWVIGSGEPIRSINPADGSLNAEVSTAGAAEVDAAVNVAAKAQRERAWRVMRPHERARLLYRVAELITAGAEDLARRQMRENGKVIAECRAQVASAAAVFRYYAGLCETLGSEVTPSRGPYWSMTVYEPAGVVAAITPWNSPLTMEAQKLAPALAAGNAVVLKPSEVTPTVGLELGRLCLEAGFPPGIVNVLAGTGAETGMPLVRHCGVRMVAFTGGTSAGRAIALAAAERLVPVVLELGGKSPHIVFADANIERAIGSIIDGIFVSTGQSCVAGSRLFVEKPVFDKVLSRLVERTRGLKVGMPDSADSMIGPLATFPHRERVERHVAAARDDGGELIVGGTRPDAPELARGAFYQPTIVVGLSNRARACQEEIFGPILCVLPFENEADLIAQANDTVYGLACGIWTPDYQKAWRVARAIEAGTVWINTYKQLSISTPFGGFKESGIGREKGVGGMRLYQLAKSIYWGLGGPLPETAP
jgi:acyl-CoA reductase-like NAD-dependent aldehyde dehydrogenase